MLPKIGLQNCPKTSQKYNVIPETNPERIPNPETQSQFANRMTRDYLMSNTVAYELKLERESVPKPTPPNITDPN